MRGASLYQDSQHHVAHGMPTGDGTTPLLPTRSTTARHAGRRPRHRHGHCTPRRHHQHHHHTHDTQLQVTKLKQSIFTTHWNQAKQDPKTPHADASNAQTDAYAINPAYPIHKACMRAWARTQLLLASFLEDENGGESE